MSDVAFVGVGVMGGPICSHVLAAGHRVRVVDMDPSALERMVDLGAESCPNPAAAASGADGVLLSLPGPSQVSEAVLGPDGILAADPLPRWIADLSTNSLDVVMELRDACTARGIAFLDAPVSGGRPKAESGELSIMIGGADDELSEVTTVLQSFTDQVFHVGGPGTGTIAKLVNNQLFLATCLLVQEAYVLGARSGLDPTELHAVLRASSSGSSAVLAPMLLKRDFEGLGFRLDIAAKDLELAGGLADRVGLELPVATAAAQFYERARASGHGSKSFHATLLEIESSAAGDETPSITRRAAS